MKNIRVAQPNLDAEANYELLLIEEELILAAQMLIQRAINESKMTQKDLASLLNVRPSYVSQMLGDSARNLTLRTVARVLHALGRKAELSFGDEAAFESEAIPVEESSVFANDDVRAFLDSDVWAAVVDVPAPAKRKSSNRRERVYGDAHTYASYDAPYLLAA